MPDPDLDAQDTEPPGKRQRTRQAAPVTSERA